MIKDFNKYPWYIRLIFYFQNMKYGAPLEASRFWGLSPKLMLGLQIFYRFIDRKSNPIPRDLKALISLRISQMNHCSFCFDLSLSFIEKMQIPLQKIDELHNYRNSNFYNDRERNVLEYSELVTLSQIEGLDKCVLNLSQFFSEYEIIELTSWIAFQNMSSKFNFALDVPAQGFCKIKK